MGRPKGSKNKKNIVVENLDDKLAAVEAEIAEMTEALKAKKAERKMLEKAKAANEVLLAAKRAEEDKAALLAAFEQSGKSLEEMLAMLKGE